MRFRSFVLAACASLAGTAIVTAPARAAQAEPAQAQAIQDALGRYVGHGSAGSAISVSPAGDGYAIAVDLKTLLHAFEAFGLSFDPATYIITASPQADGTWHVVSPGVPLVNARFQNQRISIGSNGSRFDGVFDPRLPAFTHYLSTYDSLSIGVAGENVPTQARQLQQGKQTATSTVKSEGVIDTHLTQTNSAFSQDMAYDAAPSNGGVPSRVTIKTGPTSESLDIAGLRIRALSDLWAFSVAHPSVAAVKASQADLKAALRQALPLFDIWSQDASYQQIAVESPFGPVTAHAVDVHFDTSGLTSDGHADLSFNVGGLTMPTDKLPSWSLDLIPTDVGVSNRIAGYRLDSAALKAVEDLDLNAAQPLSPATLETLEDLLGPVDQTVVTIKPSHITSAILDTRFEGEVHFADALATYRITVKAVGLDRAVQTIQTKAGQDPQAAKVIAGLLLTKGYGKAQPDGSLEWAIVGDSAGHVTVNGVDLPIGTPK